MFEFSIATGDGFVSGFDGKSKVHSLFIVYRLSTEIQASIQGLLIAMLKPIINACLGTVKHDCASIFDIEPIGIIFYLHVAIFEIPKQRFIIKPPACVRHE